MKALTRQGAGTPSGAAPMAVIHRATLSPTKLELLNDWLPDRPWAAGIGPVDVLGAYRFADPHGEVGLEAMIVRGKDGTVLHVPLAYRSAPLEGAEAHLVGTTEHSTLGTRWVYDGAGDPVWCLELARTVLGGATQVPEMVDHDGELVERQPTATVVGSGSVDVPLQAPPAVDVTERDGVAVVHCGGFHVVVVRRVGADPDTREILTGMWEGGGPAALGGISL